MINTIMRTKVNVRNGFEIENILKNLGNKNDNVKMNLSF
jgi:hypothetical protein